MTLSEAIAYLGRSYVLHPQYEPQPHHSSYALVNVRATWERVRARQPSFVEAVEQTRQRLRLVHGRVA